jgi:hypothetical protein
MAAAVNLKNPIEIRIAGMRALNAALGCEGAQAFMRQSFGGKGDYTKEKYNRPEPNYEEAIAELREIDAEMRAGGRYREGT